MSAPGRAPPFNFGDIGKYLIEKVERNEVCNDCGNPFSVGQKVWALSCNHIVHTDCSGRKHDPSDRCGGQHMSDDRYSIYTLVQRGSDLPKKKQRKQRMEEAAQEHERRENLPVDYHRRAPCIPQEDLRRLLGVGTSTAAPSQSLEAQPRDSGYICGSCGARLRADRAIFRHTKCGAVFDFSCLSQNPIACPVCKEALKVAVERLDHGL